MLVWRNLWKIYMLFYLNKRTGFFLSRSESLIDIVVRYVFFHGVFFRLTLSFFNVVISRHVLRNTHNEQKIINSGCFQSETVNKNEMIHDKAAVVY
jgi:hypothetical protein